MAKEHLASIKLKNGDAIDYYRDLENGSISLCGKDHSVTLPALTGLQTTELFTILEAMGDHVEFPGEAEEIQIGTE